MDILDLDDYEIKLEVGESIVNILYARFAPPSRIKHISNHFHSSYELHFIPYGEGTLYTDERSYHIKPGDFYLTGPNIYHEQRGNDKNPMAEYCINFEIIGDKSGSGQFKDHALISKTLRETTFWYGEDLFNSVELFEKITKESHHKYVGYIDAIKNHIQQVLINCIRSYLANPYSMDQPKMKNTDDKRRQITDLYLHGFRGELSIKELAEAVGLSERQTRRFFRGIYGMSLHDKVKEMRLNLAEERLKDTRMPISKIAADMGYEDPLYFSRVFKHSRGMSPSLFRQENQ